MGKIDDIEKLLEDEIEKEPSQKSSEDVEDEEEPVQEKQATISRELFTDSETIMISKRRPKVSFKVGNIIFVACGIFFIGFLAVIFSNEEYSEKVFAFLSGDLGKMKNAEKEAFLAQKREIEMLTANRYGNATLFYYPQNARVEITQYQYTETIDQYMDRIKRGVDSRKEPDKKEIPNASLQLKEKQIIEQLPLENLPILEKSEDGNLVYVYEYEVFIQKEGYEPRKFYFFPKESTRLVDGAEALAWEQRGPGIFLIEFKGADLLPKPETARENFVKTKHEIFCLQQRIKKEKLNISAEDMEGHYSEIRVRFGFKTSEEWKRVEEELKKDETWWKDMEKQTKNDPCSKD